MANTFFVNRHVALARIGRWCLYFPSSFAFGSAGIPGHFKNWSFCYLTLERKDSMSVTQKEAWKAAIRDVLGE